MELQKGRPADTAGRMEKEIRTYDFLDGLGVEYDRVDHGPAMTKTARRRMRFCRQRSARICFYVIVRRQHFIC